MSDVVPTGVPAPARVAIVVVDADAVAAVPTAFPAPATLASLTPAVAGILLDAVAAYAEANEATLRALVAREGDERGRAVAATLVPAMLAQREAAFADAERALAASNTDLVRRCAELGTELGAVRAAEEKARAEAAAAKAEAEARVEAARRAAAKETDDAWSAKYDDKVRALTLKLTDGGLTSDMSRQHRELAAELAAVRMELLRVRQAATDEAEAVFGPALAAARAELAATRAALDEEVEKHRGATGKNKRAEVTAEVRAALEKEYQAFMAAHARDAEVAKAELVAQVADARARVAAAEEERGRSAAAAAEAHATVARLQSQVGLLRDQVSESAEQAEARARARVEREVREPLEREAALREEAARAEAVARAEALRADLATAHAAEAAARSDAAAAAEALRAAQAAAQAQVELAQAQAQAQAQAAAAAAAAQGRDALVQEGLDAVKAAAADLLPQVAGIVGAALAAVREAASGEAANRGAGLTDALDRFTGELSAVKATVASAAAAAAAAAAASASAGGAQAAAPATLEAGAVPPSPEAAPEAAPLTLSAVLLGLGAHRVTPEGAVDDAGVWLLPAAGLLVITEAHAEAETASILAAVRAFPGAAPPSGALLLSANPTAPALAHATFGDVPALRGAAPATPAELAGFPTYLAGLAALLAAEGPRFAGATAAHARLRGVLADYTTLQRDLRGLAEHATAIADAARAMKASVEEVGSRTAASLEAVRAAMADLDGVAAPPAQRLVGVKRRFTDDGASAGAGAGAGGAAAGPEEGGATTRKRPASPQAAQREVHA